MLILSLPLSPKIVFAIPVTYKFDVMYDTVVTKTTTRRNSVGDEHTATCFTIHDIHKSGTNIVFTRLNSEMLSYFINYNMIKVHNCSKHMCY